MRSVGIVTVAERLVADIIEVDEVVMTSDIPARSDLAISVGGDGALLHTFREVPGMPLLGVNCGELGFLAEVKVGEIEQLAELLDSRPLVTEDRLVLTASVYDASGNALDTDPIFALNEIAVQKGPGRTPRLGISIDGSRLARFLVDAILVVTPTGSTGYNLSSGGPIMSPGVDAFAVTPVAPHSMWDRSIVVGPRSSVSIDNIGDRPAVLCTDGVEICTVEPGMRTEVSASRSPARLVVWERRDFARRIRRTFSLDGPSKHRFGTIAGSSATVDSDL